MSGYLDTNVCIGSFLVRILSRSEHVVDLLAKGHNLLLSVVRSSAVNEVLVMGTQEGSYALLR